MDTSQRINAGVNILPEAMLASQKMTPSSVPTSIDQPDLIDVINDSDQKHYTLIQLLRASGLIPVLQQAGPYTLFAPTDEAFAKLPPGTIDRLLQPAHHTELVSLLRYHVLKGNLAMADLLQTDGLVSTLGGQKVVVKGIDGKVMVNDVNVIRSDPGAENGTVHWVDGVLIPPT
jgi:uncharacterized surface protein with fasciclin (FAS1) repeats